LRRQHKGAGAPGRPPAAQPLKRTRLATIEIRFKLPADFSGGGIANVPGILMKQAEQARDTPLSGLVVKATNGFFLIGPPVPMILATVSAHLLKNFDFLIRGLFLGRPRLMVCQSCEVWVHSGLCPTEHIVP
jgi:hypothetical protein